MTATEPPLWVRIEVAGRYRDHWRVSVWLAEGWELARAGITAPPALLRHLPADLQAFGPSEAREYARAIHLELPAEGWDRDSPVDWARLLVLMDWLDERGAGVIVSEGADAAQPGRYPVLRY